MIEWIFFDVGSVLFNDAPQDFEAMKFFHRKIASKDPGYTFSEMLAERERRAEAGENLLLWQIAKQHLSADEIRETYLEARSALFGRYDELNLLFPAAPNVIETLAGRYKLGILANQPPECRGSLERRGLLDRFNVVAISEEISLRKPDPAIFQWAIDQAGTSPDRALMIGDRHDNDVMPAASLSMKTIWLSWESHRDKNWFPQEPDAVEFLASCDRVPFYGKPTGATSADQTVHRLADIPEAIEKLENASRSS